MTRSFGTGKCVLGTKNGFWVQICAIAWIGRELEWRYCCGGTQQRRQRLREFFSEFELTVPNVLQLGLALILWTYFNELRVCFGYIISGRDAPVHNIENSVGPFINMLVRCISSQEWQTTPSRRKKRESLNWVDGAKCHCHMNTMLGRKRGAVISSLYRPVEINTRHIVRFHSEKGLMWLRWSENYKPTTNRNNILLLYRSCPVADTKWDGDPRKSNLGKTVTNATFLCFRLGTAEKLSALNSREETGAYCFIYLVICQRKETVPDWGLDVRRLFFLKGVGHGCSALLLSFLVDEAYIQISSFPIS